MHFEGHGDVALDREEVVHINDGVFAAGEQEATVGRELCTDDIVGVTIFVLFKEDEGLECPPDRRALIDHETVRLGHAEKLAVIAESGSRNWGLEVVLCNGEHALQVEDNSVAGDVNCNEDDSSGVEGDCGDLVVGLEGQDGSPIILQVNLLDIVEDGREESVAIECNVGAHVWATEQVLSLHSIVEHHR